METLECKLADMVLEKEQDQGHAWRRPPVDDSGRHRLVDQIVMALSIHRASEAPRPARSAVQKTRRIVQSLRVRMTASLCSAVSHDHRPDRRESGA
jgi:hypothetical protein